MEKERKNPIEDIGEEEKEALMEESIQEEKEQPNREGKEDPKGKPPKEEEKSEIEEKEQIEDESAEEIEEISKKSIKEKIKNIIRTHKKGIKGILIFLCAVLVIYFLMVQFFRYHFYFGTKINGIDVSGKTLGDVKTVMASNLQDYRLKLKERGGKIEEIRGKDVGLKYSSEEEFKKIKETQNPFKWMMQSFIKEHAKITVGFSYDEKQLKEAINKLSCLDSRNITEPKNPSFQYTEEGYVIKDEIPGNKVDVDLLYSQVADSLLSGEREIDLELAGCYIKPQYHSKSPKTLEVRDTLNKYVSSEIIYTFGKRKEILDGGIINKWLTVDENFEGTIDEKKVKSYIEGLSKTYNTIGKTRSFVTSSGKTVKVSGGDYGWSIDKEKETQEVISAIKEGKSLPKEPEYNQRAFSHGNNDIGDTYVEIDLTKQHIWFYKNGSLIVQGDVVTGNVKKNHTTPKGIYKLKYKAKNVVLRGPGYASPVTYWMPFNRGIGMHDASWRREFGGNIYRTNGSHGCINSPYYVAKKIFNNIKPGTPVICY